MLSLKELLYIRYPKYSLPYHLKINLRRKSILFFKNENNPEVSKKS